MIPARLRWRSKAVNLAMLGTAGGLMTGLSGCGQSGTFHRNIYNGLLDCAADYSALICSSKGEQGNGRFLGPVYRMVGGRPSSCNSHDPGGGPALGSRRIATEIERGGFGVACRSRSWSSGSSGSSRSGFHSWGG